ncbi:MAG: PIN domain-containing protein [Candidatus Kapaibacterium sp.]|jgi:predicted nucleic acid-binding protein
MNNQEVLTAVLDACVLYPAPIRDLLLSLASEGLFEPKWSKMINEEWVRNLLLKRKDIKRERLEVTVGFMNKSFPLANTRNYRNLTTKLNLPDKNDNHVLSSAIKSKSQYIVTSNLKDFPSIILKEYNINAIHPDEFILNLLKNNEERSLKAFSELMYRLKNPPITQEELLIIFEKIGLSKTSSKLAELTKTPPK